MQDVQVRHIMTAPVLSIDVREPITEAIRLFADHPVHHVPVVDGEVVKGMLSTADMLKLEHFLPQPGAPVSAAVLNGRFKIDRLMRSPVFAAALGDSIAEAASRMVKHAVHALPVLDDGDRLLGIVTTTDIMQALLHGIGIRRSVDRPDGGTRPTELTLRRSIEAANAAVLAGADADGVAASMLYLNERNAFLEALRVDVARYVRGGQDERLHSKLLRDLDKLEDTARGTEFSIPL
jgi:CBS domain-containing membrane protein